MGTVLVAVPAACVAGVFIAKITSTLSRMSSAARSGSRSFLPSANRHSMARFCPSTQLRSRSSRRNASNRGEGSERGSPGERTPIRATLTGCCASATTRTSRETSVRTATRPSAVSPTRLPLTKGSITRIEDDIFACSAPVVRPTHGSAVAASEASSGGWDRNFDARRWLALQHLDECTPVDLAVAQDGRQETGANRLASVDRYYSSSPVRVPKEVVAALDPSDLSKPTRRKAATTSRPVTRGRRVTLL
jgi:hypothetical protein